MSPAAAKMPSSSPASYGQVIEYIQGQPEHHALGIENREFAKKKQAY